MSLPATLDLSLNYNTISDGFTQSELSLLDECALQWNFRYNLRLEKIDTFNWNFWVGGAWHKFQEMWRKTKGNYDPLKVDAPEIPVNIARDSKFEETLDYWMNVLPAYQQTYAKFFKGEEKLEYSIIEEHLHYAAPGFDFELRGKLDLAKFDKKGKNSFICDFKSTSSAWLISTEGWHFKLQFMLYCWLVTKCHPEWKKQQFDFKLDMMQRPGLRQTQKENWAQHIARVVKDIPDRPDHYFRRDSFLITPDAIDRFEQTVLIPKCQRIALVIDNPEECVSIITNPNTNSCNKFGNLCDYFNICEKGWKAGRFFFEQRAVKHKELE